MKCTLCGEPTGQPYEDESGKLITPTMCGPCGRMVGGARRKREQEVGSGNIRTTLNDGRWARLNNGEQWRFLADETGEGVEYQLGDEVLTDKEMFLRSLYVVRKIVRRKYGYMKLEDIEDCAADAYTMFIEGVANGKDIQNLRKFHGSCCKVAILRFMQGRARMRVVNLSDEMIAYAEVHNFPFLTMGASERLDVQPSDEVIKHNGLAFYFDRARLTRRERAAFTGMITYRNKGLGSPQSAVRRAINNAIKKLRVVVGEDGDITEAIVAAIKERKL